MIKNLLINMIMSFVVRAISKWGNGLDWNLVRSGFAERAAKIMPGEFLDEAAISFVNGALSVVERLVTDKGLIESLLDMGKNKNLQGMLQLLKDAVLDEYLPAEERDLAMSESESLTLAFSKAV